MREIGNPTVAIAVLPFEDEAKDPDQGYFARGFIEELAIELSRFSTLEIIHPQTSFSAPISDLKVNYLLRGSVRRMDDTVRVTALLVDAVSGRSHDGTRFRAVPNRIFLLDFKNVRFRQFDRHAVSHEAKRGRGQIFDFAFCDLAGNISHRNLIPFLNQHL